MWRLALFMSLALTLALGSPAAAKCGFCVESVQGQTADGGLWSAGKELTLLASVRSMSGAALPDSGLAVVMQADGERTKCINVTLTKQGQDGTLATYVGTFTPYKHAVYSGRVDIGGDIAEFTLPLGGEAGTVRPVEPGESLAAAPAVTTAAPAVTAQPVATPQAAADTAIAAGWQLELPAGRSGLAAIAAAAGLLFAAALFNERRRASSRSAAR